MLCIREIITTTSSECLRDTCISSKTSNLMLSDANIFSEPLSKHRLINHTPSDARLKSQQRLGRFDIKDSTIGGMIHLNCKLDGSEFITLTVAISGFTILHEEGQRLVSLILLDRHDTCRDDNFSAFERCILELRDVIMSANLCTKKSALIEAFDAVSRLRFTLFLPRKELHYCTHYTLSEPGLLIELTLPMEAHLNKALRSYLDALAFGFLFLCHPRITFYAPVLELDEDFLPRYHLAPDEDYLRSVLTRAYKKDFIVSSSDFSKDEYSAVASVCISPSQGLLDQFPIEYLVIVNNTPLIGLRSPLCPTTLEHLDFLVEFNIPINRLTLAEELALERPFSSFYKAVPQSGASVESCIIIIAINFNSTVKFAASDKSFMVPHPVLSSDLSRGLMRAFSECISKFPSRIEKVADQKRKLQELSARHILADIEVLSSLLLTEEELNAFTRKHNAPTLEEAISKTFAPVLIG